jgi:hypothetical protein
MDLKSHVHISKAVQYGALIENSWKDMYESCQIAVKSEMGRHDRRGAES